MTAEEAGSAANDSEFKPPRNTPPDSQRALMHVVQRYADFHGRHAWPPEVVVHDHWVGPFAALIEQEEAAVPAAQEAAADVREYVRLIAQS